MRHFCLEEECQQVLQWFNEQGFERPEGHDERVALAGKLRELSNEKYEASDFQSAMMYALGSLHCLDFSQARSALQNDAQKQQVLKLLVPVLSNLSIVFLKRSGDGYNAARAADFGLERLKRMPQDADASKFRAKLLFRRGLAKGQTKNFVEARADLREAARLMPDNREIRKALENCKAADAQQKGAPDDQWRGVLTETPKVSRLQAKLRRCWRSTRAAVLDVVGTRALLVVLLGPFLSYALQVAVLTWARNREAPSIAEVM